MLEIRHFVFHFILTLIALCYFSRDLHAQRTYDDQEMQQLEKRIDNIYGNEKLLALNDLRDYYLNSNLRKANKYTKQAEQLADNIFKNGISSFNADLKFEWTRTYFLSGLILYKRGKYLTAKEKFEYLSTIAHDLNDGLNIENSQIYLVKLDSIAETGEDLTRGFIGRTWESLELDETFNEISNEVSVGSTLKLAQTYENSEKYQEAIDQYLKAINLLKNQGEWEEISSVRKKVAGLYEMIGEEEKAIEQYDMAIAETKALNDSATYETLESILPDTAFNNTIPEVNLPVKIPVSEQEEILDEKQEDYREMASQLLEEGNYEGAYNALALAEQIEAEKQKLQLAESEVSNLRLQKQVTEQNLKANQLQLSQQQRQKKSLFFGLGFVIVLAALILILYFTKRKDHRRLTVAYNNLDATKVKLGEAEKRIRTLLHQQVSEDIARELISSKKGLGTSRKFVCVMFLDIRDFTPFAEKHEPEEIIKYQNDVFGFMIDIVAKNNGNINQFMGDGFMATFGAPVSNGNDSENAYNAAMEIAEAVKAKSDEKSIPFTKIGIGLHSGYVVAGNVGTEVRKQYSITGNTVIIAARLEQLNKKFNSQIIISKDVYEKLEHCDGTPSFEEVQVKGIKKPLEIWKVG